MKLFIEKDISKTDKKAFEVVKTQVNLKPNSLVGFAVGKTTDGLHQLISKDVLKNPKRWSRLKLFQIDEYLGISPNSDLSFNKEIKRELKPLLNLLKKKNIFLINGRKKSNQTIKEAYDFIKKNGEFDLITLGIGPKYDPHIAFNTTGKSSLNSKMRVVDLHPKLVRARHGVPLQGITLGIQDILESKKVLLIAYGKEKTKSLQKAFFGKINMKRASASALQKHKDLIVILDKACEFGLL